MASLPSHLEAREAAGAVQRLWALTRSQVVDDAAAATAPWPRLLLHWHDEAPSKLKTALVRAREAKLAAELTLVRRACQVSGEAHAALMRATRAGVLEGQLAALFAFYVGVRGCRHLGYEPIVGSGARAAILHYRANERVLEDGQLVLVDAGGELRGYTADITRTFPVSGRFTDEQRRLYALVLRLQLAAIARCRVGADYRQDVMLPTARQLCEELVNEGLLRGVTAAEAHAKSLDRLFMPHGLGHCVGLDVHDCATYPTMPLTEGSLVTIEPGLYFNAALLLPALEDKERASFLDVERVQSGLRHVGGIRIEDIVLVTRHGPEVLTSAAPKEVDDIERLMLSGRHSS